MRAVGCRRSVGGRVLPITRRRTSDADKRCRHCAWLHLILDGSASVDPLHALVVGLQGPEAHGEPGPVAELCAHVCGQVLGLAGPAVAYLG